MAGMNTVDLSSWLDFEAAVRDLERRRRELESKTSRSFGVQLFRGLGSSTWGLETTLERSYPLEASGETIGLSEYYRDVCASKSVVETFTERQWDGLPDTPDFSQLLADFATLGAQLFFSKHIDVYRYFVYLRHHGFASPLLDWTASPYIAAFFAFDSMPEDAEYVSIYAMSRDSLRVTSSGTPDIKILGPYVRSHRRHLPPTEPVLYLPGMVSGSSVPPARRGNGNCRRSRDRRRTVQIEHPGARDGTQALKNLDLMNVNGFSLFARRERLLRRSSV